MMKEELDAIKNRVSKATPGPWYAHKDKDNLDRCGGIYPFEGNRLPAGATSWVWDAIVVTDGGYYPPRMDDAEFIAHAREDVPLLLEEVRRLSAVVKMLQNRANGRPLDE